MASTMIITNGYKHLITALLIGISLFPTLSVAGEANLKIMTWNLEWLSTTPVAKFKASVRDDDDFDALKRHFKGVNPDILAFQEVDSIDAIRRVVGSGYEIYLSDRSDSHNRHHQFSSINQYTGFAVRDSISVKDTPDFPLTTGDKLRFASTVVLKRNDGTKVHLLSLHLKAGCSGKFTSKASCQTLKQQGQVIRSWLKQRDVNQEPYVVLGDFNHNLSFNGDWLWETMTKGLKATPRLASKSTPALCKVRSNRNPKRTHQFKSLIDHIVVSPDLRTTSAKQDVMPTSDVLNYQLSDHCPLSVELY